MPKLITFKLKLKKPFPMTLQSLGKLSANVLVIMPKQSASQPHSAYSFESRCALKRSTIGGSMPSSSITSSMLSLSYGTIDCDE
jgi:hypothetical protein